MTDVKNRATFGKLPEKKRKYVTSFKHLILFQMMFKTQ